MFPKLAILAVLSLSVALGDVVIANNAGPLPSSAEDLSADGSLGAIVGSLYTSSDNSPYPNFESVFKIDILNYRDFSAQTVPVSPHAVADTDLFLFDASGHGVYANDDASATNTLSCLPSADGANPCSSSANGLGPKSNGIYYLAIAIGANYPVSSGGEIFNILNSTDVVGPDLTMGGGSPINGWDDGAFAQPDFDDVNYAIVLSGTTPEPATWLLMAAPLLALFLLRKRMA